MSGILQVSQCAERAYRDQLSDAEFWEHVFNSGRVPYDDEPEPPESDEILIDTPCPVCGSTRACGYDNEGLPMIHAIQDDWGGA